MPGRTTLLCALVVALGGTFFIEQPGSSLMEYYDKMVWLSRVLPVSGLQVIISIFSVASVSGVGFSRLAANPPI